MWKFLWILLNIYFFSKFPVLKSSTLTLFLTKNKDNCSILDTTRESPELCASIFQCSSYIMSFFRLDNDGKSDFSILLPEWKAMKKREKRTEKIKEKRKEETAWKKKERENIQPIKYTWSEISEQIRTTVHQLRSINNHLGRDDRT